MHTVCVSPSLCRTMLTKDVKVGVKVDKGTAEVIEVRPPTPGLFKAALQVTEEAGIEGTFAKLKKSYMATEVLAMALIEQNFCMLYGLALNVRTYCMLYVLALSIV